MKSIERQYQDEIDAAKERIAQLEAALRDLIRDAEDVPVDSPYSMRRAIGAARTALKEQGK